MKIFTSNCGTRFMCTNLGEVQGAPVICKIDLSSEDVVGESSSCNLTAKTSITASVLRGHSLSQFRNSPVGRKVTNAEKRISHRNFDAAKLLIDKESYNSMDVNNSRRRR